MRVIAISLAPIVCAACVACAGCADEPDAALSIFAEKLSAYGFFDGAMREQAPAAGVVPYDVISNLYADGAGKHRFIALPAGGKIQYDPAAPWQFPDGTTLIKSFHVTLDARRPVESRRMVETRLLQKKEGAWYAVTYIWNEAQTDADRFVAGRAFHFDLVDEMGRAAPLDYNVPSTAQCKSCHGQKKKNVPLGPRARQLNRDYDHGKGPENQLAHLLALGLFDTGPIDPAKADQLADPAGAASLDERARSYLDANCAHCHNEQGFAASTALRLQNETTSPIDLGVCRRPVAAGAGSGGFFFDVVPGKPDESILIHRMKSNDPKTKMPQLPLTTVDEFGVQLVSEWIRRLPGGPCN